MLDPHPVVVIGASLVAFAAVVAGAIYVSALLDGYVCKVKSTQMGKEWQYSLLTDCMIKHKGEWVPLHSYRVLD